MATGTETKTIMEFLSENPNVDVSKAWERCWGIHSRTVERIRARFDVARHAQTKGEDYWKSPDGQLEGAFMGYTGPQMDWLVHSWLGNRKQSILDMNATAFLSQQTRVPHLGIIFGTIPKLYFYAEYTPRVDLRTHYEYLQKYYEPANEDFLKFRSDPSWTRFVSHGTYLRALMSPICTSSHTELNEDNIGTCERFLVRFVDRWFRWLDEAEEVPLEERAAQQAYDYKVRELGYRTDPMNVLPMRIFGEKEFNRRLDMRIGTRQMAETRNRWAGNSSAPRKKVKPTRPAARRKPARKAPAARPTKSARKPKKGATRRGAK
jgi:Red chlorophyll catabolite reductase (RCC reductase)